MYWLSFLLSTAFLKLSCAQQFKRWSHVTLVSSCLPRSKLHSIWVSEHRFLSLTNVKIWDAGNHMNLAEWHCKLGVIWGCLVVSVPESMWPSCLLGYPSLYLFPHVSTACMGHGMSQTRWRHSRGLSIDKTCLSEIQALLISSQCICPLEECLWHSLGAALELCGVCCHPTWVSDFCYRTGPRSYSNVSQWWSHLRASCIWFTRMWLLKS